MLHEGRKASFFRFPRLRSYVYGTETPAFPGLIKIGKAADLNARLINLNTSCKPKPHVIVAVAPTLDSARDERAAHEFFASRRAQGEFFQISEAEVKAYFANHIAAQFHLEMSQRLASLSGGESRLFERLDQC